MTNPTQTGEFQRKLGLFDATMLVSGSMIGSGIFIVSAGITQDVGSSGWLLGIWILCGIITVMGALSYAELAAMMPHAGGQYVYLREAYGSLWAFLYGWTFFLVIQCGFIAAVSVAFAKFLGVLAPSLGTGQTGAVMKWDLGIDLVMPVPWLSEEDWPSFFKHPDFTITRGQFVAVAVTVVLTFINCFGVQAAKLVQNIFTVTKLCSMAVLITLGFTIAMNHETLASNFTNIWDGIWTTKQFIAVNTIVPIAGLAAAMVVGGAMVGALFSSDSWNNVTFTAGETKDPKRNLPRSLVLGTSVVTGLYILANLAYLAALPIQGNEKAILEKTVAVKVAERELAGRELQTKDDQLKTARRQLQFYLDSQRLVDLKAKNDPKAPSLEQESKRQVALIEVFKKMVKDEEAGVTEARKRVAEMEAELTFVSGIDRAKDERVGTAVLERASPYFGVTFMAIAIMISTFGCVNGLVLSGPRLYYAMAKDGLFFQSVGKLNARGTPVAGLVLQGLWSIVLIFSGTYNDLLDYIIFAALLFYVMTVAGLFVLRRTQPNAERPYKALGYPVVPALYIALCTFIMLDLLIVKPVYSWPSFLIVLTGIPVFFLWRGGRQAARS